MATIYPKPERLQKLDTLSRERREQYADMVFVYKACTVLSIALPLALDLS